MLVMWPRLREQVIVRLLAIFGQRRRLLSGRRIFARLAAGVDIRDMDV